MYFKDLLRHRQVWLGAALLWIIMFHLPLDLGYLHYLKLFGYGGVDICVFASGIGCFYSLSSDPDAARFMKRRLKRLMPTYVVFIALWLVYKYLIGEFCFQMAVGNLLALQNFTGFGQAYNWYIGATLFFYLLAPYFKAIVDQAASVRKYLFLVFLLVCSIPFWGSEPYMIVVSRLPVFYAGMLFADRCQKNERISGGQIAGMVGALVLGLLILAVSHFSFPQYLWSRGLYWHPFLLITPPLCTAISWTANLLEKTRIGKPVVFFLSLCGNFSLELCLVHVELMVIIPAFIEKHNLSHMSNLIWVAGLGVLFAGCFALRRITGLFDRCSKMKVKR